jgi:hypothetical protein
MGQYPISLLLLLTVVGSAASDPAPAQGEADPPAVYRREVFHYPRGGRPDPYRSLLSAEDLGYRIEDMRLAGIIYSPDRRRSVAVLSEALTKKRFRLRVGERIGGITVAAIYPRRVDVVIDEFGVIRRESLHLRRPLPVVQEEQQGRGATPLPPPQPAPGRGMEPQKGSGR